MATDIKFLEMHGQRLAYRDDGRGQAVVLLHGMAGSSQTWEPVIPGLAKRHRVIAPDLLGHGQSAKPRSDYSLGAFAAGLRDLLDELDIERATIVGHSLGGGVAMEFLYQHPQYCRRLVLISSGGLGSEVGWILKLLATPGAELVLSAFASKALLAVGNRMRNWFNAMGFGSPRTDQIWRGYDSLSDPATRTAFLRTLRSVVDYRGQSVSALARLGLSTDVPTLLIWGDRDAIIPVEHGTAALAARPESQLKVLPGLGHFAHVESPAAVVDMISDFIDADRANNISAQHDSALRPPPAATGAELRLLHDSLQSRRQFEVAVGVLMGLRGCSEVEANREITSAAEDMRIDAGELGDALVDIASGSHNSPHREAVSHRWRHLLALRGLNADRRPAAIGRPLRVRYGPENNDIVC